MKTPKTDEAWERSGNSNRQAWVLAREFEAENAKLKEYIKEVCADFEEFGTVYGAAFIELRRLANLD